MKTSSQHGSVSPLPFGCELRNRIANSSFFVTLLPQQITGNRPGRIVHGLISVLAFLVPVAVLGWLVFSGFAAGGGESPASLTFTSAGAIDASGQLSMPEAQDLRKVRFTSDQSGEFASLLFAPVRIYWEPAVFPLIHDAVQVTAELRGAATNLELPCPICQPKERELSKTFSIPQLTSSVLVGEFVPEQIFVYHHDELPAPASESPIQWMRRVLPAGEPVVIEPNDLFLKSELLRDDLPDWQGAHTEIPIRLRGVNELYVVAGDEIVLDLTKQDLNRAQGEDTAMVTILDIDGREIFSRQIGDDGITGAKVDGEGESKTITIRKRLPQTGVYRVRVALTSDVVITSIRMNTEKIVFYGGISLAGPASVVVSAPRQKRVNAEITAVEHEQVIRVTDESGTQDLLLSAAGAGTAQSFQVQPGVSQISTEAQVRLNGAIFSADPSHLFDPFQFDLTVQPAEPTATVVTNVHSETLEDGWQRVSVNFSRDEIRRVGDITQLQFLLTSAEFKQSYTLYTTLLEHRGFRQVASRDTISVWADEAIVTEPIRQEQMMKDFLLQTFPFGSTIYLDQRIPLTQTDFTTSEPEGLRTAAEPFVDLPVSIESKQRFFLYLKDSLHIELTKQDKNARSGRDVAKVTLAQVGKTPTCEESLSDDGITGVTGVGDGNVYQVGCTGLQPGIYELQINPGRDASIDQLRLNTNKVVAVDRLDSPVPLTLYTNFLQPRQLEFVVRDAESTDAVQIGDDIFEVTNSVVGKWQFHPVAAGLQTLTFSQSDFTVAAPYFAFSPEHWFEPFSLRLTGNVRAEKVGAVVDDTSKQNLEIRSFSVVPINL